MMKESCQSYVSEMSKIKTALGEMFPSVVPSFPKGVIEAILFWLFEVRMKKYPIENNLCLDEHCIE